MPSTMTVSFRGFTREVSPSAGLEFGSRPSTGLTLTTRNAAVQPFVHGVCGWFGYNEGWFVKRREGTGNLDTWIEVDRDRLPLRSGQTLYLAPTPGRMSVTVETDQDVTETLTLDWTITAAAPRVHVPSAGATQTVIAKRNTQAAVAPIALTDHQRRVLACFAEPLLRPGSRLRHRTTQEVADLLSMSYRAVAQILAAAKRRMHEARWPDEDLDDRRGYAQAMETVSWLVDIGAITERDLSATDAARSA